MRIIISPAKRMREDGETIVPCDLPVYIRKAEELLAWLRTLDFEELRKLWSCSTEIAEENLERLIGMDLYHPSTPAILAYDGIQFKYMAPGVFENGMFDYVQEHVRILSGFYGVLKPMDGIVCYRLEMQAKAEANGCKNLYEFWDDAIYKEVIPGDRTIINLASKEYSRCVEKFIFKNDRYINCVFGEIVGDKVVQKGVYAKMARGEMVRFLAEISADQPEQVKAFDRLNYRYCPERSTENEYVFIRADASI